MWVPPLLEPPLLEPPLLEPPLLEPPLLVPPALFEPALPTEPPDDNPAPPPEVGFAEPPVEALIPAVEVEPPVVALAPPLPPDPGGDPAGSLLQARTLTATEMNSHRVLEVGARGAGSATASALWQAPAVEAKELGCSWRTWSARFINDLQFSPGE